MRKKGPKVSAFFGNLRLQIVLVFLLAVLQYANTGRHDYAWDDAIVLTQNTRVQKGLSDIPDLFRNIKSNETQNRYGYRPIALLSFATDVELFGMDPKASHWVNIFLYAITCVLVLLFVRMLFPEKPLGSLLITLLFVVHPLHTEVVANIKSRDEILALAFGLGALMAFIRYIKQPRPRWVLLTLLLLLLAFLSKESAVALVGVAFVLPWVVLGPADHQSNLKRTIPLLAVLAVLLLSRALAYSDWFFESNDFELVQKGLFIEDGYVGNPLFDASWKERFATAIFLIGYFLYRFIMPYPLLHDYSYDQFAVQSFGGPLVWVSIILLSVLLYFSVQGLLKRRPYGFGLILFLVSGSVYLHLVQIAPDIFAERFLFVPSLGLCMALLTFTDHAKTSRWVHPLLVALLVPMFAYSYQRNKAWKDNRTLLETDLPRLSNCVRANYNYALFLHNEYYHLPEQQKPQAQKEILRYYEQTMRITDRLFNVYIDLGGAYMEFGMPDKAYDVFVKATENYPQHSLPWVQLGKYHMSFKQYAKAIPYFKRAMRNGSKNSDYNYLMAICLFNSGWYEEAIETMLEGEQLGVSSPAYHSLLARLYVKLGQTEAAKEALKRGLALYPNDPELNNTLSQLNARSE